MLFYRFRFASQGRFLGAQVYALHQTAVGRYQHPGFQQHDVSQHQFPGRDLAHLSITPDLYRGHGQFFQGRHGLLGPVLLGESQDGIQHHDGHDGDCVFVVTQEGRDDGGNDQDDNHHRRQLFPQDAPGTFETVLNQFVRPILGQAAFGFGLSKPLSKAGLQSRQDLRSFQTIPIGHFFLSSMITPRSRRI